jgi:hypothetical protein
VDPFREYPDPQVKEVMILLDCSGSKERIRNEYELEKVAAALLRMQNSILNTALLNGRI